MVDSWTPVEVSATLLYDFTELDPPVHDQFVDHDTDPSISESMVVHCDPESALLAPQRF